MPTSAVSSGFHLFVLYATLAVCYAPEWIGTFLQNPERHAKRRDGGSYAVLLVAMFAGIFFGFFFMYRPAAAVTWHPVLWFWTGIILMLAGAVYRWYAIQVLGRFFTRSVATRAGQYVVDRGPYRHLRHLSYAGAWLTLPGLGMAMANWASLVVVLAGGIMGYGWRMRIEERVLCADLGEPYRQYMRRTWRIVPHVW
ncbi:MAG TPA: isoprenylcysteine carboxylmethyltransferase family protein [Rhodanobacteraceae bacterium]|nr:isoprenylcysteine carboxylmethyltransferase family protein [Rhodanobacteraceae bacterium]